MSGWILWRESVPEVEGFGIIGDPTREDFCDGQTAHLQRSGEFRSIRGNSVSDRRRPNFGVSAQVGVNATREPAVSRRARRAIAGPAGDSQAGLGFLVLVRLELTDSG